MSELTNPLPADGARPGRADALEDKYRKMRSDDRIDCHIAAHAVQDGYRVPCTVLDISPGGAKLQFDSLSTQSIHDRPIVLDIPHIGGLPATFRWRAGDRGGVIFTLSELNQSALRRKLAEYF
ncbi:PilZ domain-containing protein [Tropicibacter sp. S64]|uniref:PilZ domain-containing protein n=1 Tax=Tropicibacter sp. S64 TaxID=3415122 RepID=UPI003C7C6474